MPVETSSMPIATALTLRLVESWRLAWISRWIKVHKLDRRHTSNVFLDSCTRIFRALRLSLSLCAKKTREPMCRFSRFSLSKVSWTQTKLLVKLLKSRAGSSDIFKKMNTPEKLGNIFMQSLVDLSSRILLNFPYHHTNIVPHSMHNFGC